MARRTRYLRRNPTTTTWLLLGGAVAAVAAYVLLTKKASAASGGGGGGGGAPVGSGCTDMANKLLPFMIASAKAKAACDKGDATACAQIAQWQPAVNAYASELMKQCAPALLAQIPAGVLPSGPLPALPAAPAVPEACRAAYMAMLPIMSQANALATECASTPTSADCQAKMQALQAQMTTLGNTIAPACGLPNFSMMDL